MDYESKGLTKLTNAGYGETILSYPLRLLIEKKNMKWRPSLLTMKTDKDERRRDNS